jgi:hypothetical protein
MGRFGKNAQTACGKTNDYLKTGQPNSSNDRTRRS